jgi:hypothetical protein
MASGSRNTLFGMTLTELVIILFFIMLLLALDSIDDLNEQIPDSNEDIVAASAVVELLIPDGEINSDLIPFDVIKDEIAKLQQDKEELEDIKKASEGDGDGDCKEGGNWINSKCADYCWAVDADENKRPYDVLLDVGMCNNSIVVQRSQWLKNLESNFVQVPGALEAAQQNVMSKGELYKYLDDIKQPGYERSPKQCFHVVRLVELEQIYADPWTKNMLEVQERVSTELYTLGKPGYSKVREQFPEDICNVAEEPETAPIKDIKEDFPVTESFQEPITKFKNKSFPETVLNIIEPKIEFTSFLDAFTKECIKSRPIRNKDITLNYKISLTNEGNVTDVELLSEDDLINSNLKRLDNMTKKALRKTTFTPKYLEEIAVSSSLIQKIPFGANACT